MLDVTLQATLKGHQNQIFALETGTDHTLFSGGNDKGVVEWDLETFQFRRILCAVSHPVYVLHRIPDTSLLAIGLRSGEVMIVDYVAQELKAKLKLDKGAVFAIRSIFDKQELIAIGEEGVAYVFDTVTFKRLYRFRVSNVTVRTIVVSDEKQSIYFGDKEGAVFRYGTVDYQMIGHSAIHSMPITSLLYRDNELFSGGRDAKLYKLDAENLHIIQDVTPHMFTVYSIIALPEHSLIATVSRDKTWKIWDPSSFSLLKNISIDRGYDSHHLSINTALWNGEYFFTAGDDKMIKAWKID